MNNKRETKKMTRGQKAIISTITSFGLEIVTIVSALIIPRLILRNFGSEVNGLISSITQFLGYASLLQIGVGGVIRAELYKPLAEKNYVKVNKVMKATISFFKRIAWLCCIYIMFLSVLYPKIAVQSFDFFYTFTLIIIIGASTASQYFWGFPYRSLVMADQKVYVYDFLQIICVIINIVLTVILVLLGCSIHIVKFGSSVIFCVQPILLKKYCEKHYLLDSKVEPDEKAIKQRWNGLGYSIADFVHRNTDIFVITIFANLKLVSVYSVYSIVYNGINSLITMCTNSFGAAIGDMIAKKEKEILNNTFRIYELITHVVSSIVYSIALIMIIPFICLYTKGITDINYVEKTFSIIILSAELIFCLRQPFQTIVTSAGHFKQTQKGAFLEALFNIIISIILIFRYGLIGIAIGTLISMIYRTIDLIIYVKKELLTISWLNIVKRYFISFLTIIIPVLVISNLNIQIDSVIEWIYYSILWGSLISIEVICINWIIYHKDFSIFINKIKSNLIMTKKIKKQKEG